MATSHGFDRFTGQPLSGWAHVLQSLDELFETEIGEHLMLGALGAGLRRLLGRKMTPGNMALATALAAVAVASWDPRLRVVKLSVAPSAEEVRDGAMGFVLDVAYRPLGHLGILDEEEAYFGVGLREDGTLTRLAA